MLAAALALVREVLEEVASTGRWGPGRGPRPGRLHRASRCRRRSCLGGRLPCPGRGVARAGCPVVLDNDVNVLAVGASSTPASPRAPGTSCTSRSAPASAAASSSTETSTAGQRLCGRHRAHPHRGVRRPSLRQHRLPEAFSGRRAGAGRHHRGALGPLAGPGRPAAGEGVSSPRSTSVRRCPRATPGRAATDPGQRAPRRAGARGAGLVLQPRDDRDRRRRPAWHALLSEIRGVTTASPRRWPPGTCPSCCPSSATGGRGLSRPAHLGGRLLAVAPSRSPLSTLTLKSLPSTVESFA